MDKDIVINAVAAEVRRRFEGEGSGHDWWHIDRVWKMARRIGQEEHADLFVVELATLLHDIADWKFHGGDETVGPRVTREILTAQGVPQDVIAHVAEIVETSGYKGGVAKPGMRTLEGACMQDADRLEAIGAIGIARTFAYGGHKGNPMYDPEITPTEFASKEAYAKHKGTTVNHFYEKLFKLKDRMNTATGKRLALARHRFMEEFLERFYLECKGEA